MASRRYPLVELLISVAGLFVQAYIWKRWKQRDGSDGPPSISPKGVFVGMLNQIAFNWAYDRDVGCLRTNKYRTLAYGATSGLIQRRVFPSTEFRYSFSTGGLVGTTLYRTRYGLLRPVPNSER